MFDKIRNLKVEKKLKTCFIIVVLLASISGVLGIFVLLFTNNSYSRALVKNGFNFLLILSSIILIIFFSFYSSSHGKKKRCKAHTEIETLHLIIIIL